MWDTILFPRRRKILKKNSVIALVLGLIILFCTTSCSLKTDDLDGATIYTTVYPINYLTEYLYKDYATISSIYPKDADLSEYKLTSKQIKTYAKGDLFIYNGLTDEKLIAKDLLNKNKDLLIIDVSNSLSLKNDPTELWLSPNNYLMLAKNIKDSLIEKLNSKLIIESIEANYKKFEEEISVMDASLHSLGKSAIEKGNNIIVTTNNTFKYLENYGFSVISLQDENNQKENKLNAIKSNFKSGKYKYLLVADTDNPEDEITEDIIENYKAEVIVVDTLTITLTTDYFEAMTKYFENLKKIVG